MMLPQILIQEMPTEGVHSGAIGKTIGIDDPNKKWKKRRIVVLMPAGDNIPVKVYLSHVNLIYPINNGILHMAAIGMEVGAAYSTAIEQIIEHPIIGDWEYILTMEHDNMPPADGIIKLLRRMDEHPELSAIAGLYHARDEIRLPYILGDINDPAVNFVVQEPDPNGGLVECCGVPMGFTLWRMDMFKSEKLRRPWFKTTEPEDGYICGQDLYFWTDARQQGFRCAVDCGVKVGHYDQATDTIW